ncbi:T9SS type A sorting domain-containing protein [Flavihumibacter sp. RY-1]|uniref:T9SS type A sorting domain-containing protein n=1 Tax=Flavihumibacter fluminis TaxID=2909236 RepID=A0ABS9BGU5_9BACT|nr:T9SS type A sorting domain-containing protein [Flavihumibacter fluminis]MCF1714781.1 T9SS type A sorting domain-containing protein [Flavihumibacter fluminis]
MKQTNHMIWRISSVLTLILTLFVSSTKAQAPLPAIPEGRLLSWPLSDQLYPRNLNTNQASIPVSIRMRGSTQFNRLQVQFFRDANNNTFYDEPPVSTTTLLLSNFPIVNDSITVSFPSYTINAELRHYGFILNGLRIDNSSQQLAVSTDIVAGDTYIIQGQSNSYAERRADGDAQNEPNSRFIKSYGSSHPNGVSAYSRTWGKGNGNVNNATNYNVGMWGMRLATQIATLEQIPVAIFCGGFGDKISIFESNSNAYISTDNENNYRRLRRRLFDAGVQNNVRGIFWWQGESDGIIETNKTSRTDYINSFNAIKTAWLNDYPTVEKIFIVQIKLGCYGGSTPPISSALEIMQAQLDLAKSDNNIEIFSTQNLEHILETGTGIPPGGWYCHYGYNNGYLTAGNLFLPTVRQELYGLAYQNNTRSGYPVAADVTSIGFPATQITVELNNPEDTYQIIPLTGNNIAEYFRVEGGGGGYVVNNVSINGKNIIINFSNPGNNIPTSVSYFGRQQFGAPTIENSGGHAIVAFTQPIVGGSLPIDPLLLTVSRTGGAHQLRWKAESNERFDQFVVERGETRNSFKTIYEVYGTGQSGTIQYDFTDNKPNATVSHYRIRAIQQDGRELFSQVVTVNNRLNSVKEFRVYPNPVAGSANATINMNEAALATINLHDASGRLLSSRKLQLQKGNNQFSLGELLDYNPGTYIVRVVTATETQQIRVVKAK